MKVTITGGAGYIGARASRELLSAGHEVTVLDSLLHGQDEVASALEASGIRMIRGDVRDPAARRDALDGAAAVVHLAAIVGDPACALDPGLSQTVNVDATRAVVADAEAAGVERFVFASTCSNYGRMTDPLVPIDETARSRRCRSTPSRRWPSSATCSHAPSARSRSSPACGSPRSTASPSACASTSR